MHALEVCFRKEEEKGKLKEKVDQLVINKGNKNVTD